MNYEIVVRREVMDGITCGNFVNCFCFEHRCGSVRKDHFGSLWSGRGLLDVTSCERTRKISCNLFNLCSISTFILLSSANLLPIYIVSHVTL